ncbi:amidohydrolase family protein [Prochlorococcus marinus]|uniref:amidohydrolase family protein n=1 Tax=Prochlorococcus marinus TaxID=1219 RepID=UPI0022B53FA5|nr:amidohydrolase family protein [Prochlorococcus marinus]
MFAQKKTSTDIQSIEALVPRSLITSGGDVLGAEISSEGLCPLRVHLQEGVIRKFEIIENFANPSMGLLLPRLIEPHTHIDKAFTWQSWPNLSGTYQGALQANLNEYKERTIKQVRARANKALNLCLRNGLRAVRTHVDSFGWIGDQSWEVLLELKKDWQPFIDLQLVALVPLDYWITDHGKTLARKISRNRGLIGGVIAPPYEKRKLRSLLMNLFSLANDLSCGVDLHIDETSITPSGGLREMLNVLDHIKLDVPVTCSHLSSMGLLSQKAINFFADKLAHHQINVISLPITNYWLLSRCPKSTPIKRPLAPVKQLQYSGVNVAIGGDNVQDPWNPGGNFDPISLMANAVSMTHIAPWERLGLSTFITAPSRLMGLEWDGTFQKGSSADFVLLDIDSWSGAMSRPPSRKIMIKGKWLELN